MENIYAVMILHKAGKEVNETSVKRVLEAANANVDEIRIKTLIKKLDRVDIKKTIEQSKTEQVEKKKEAVIEKPVEVEKEDDAAKGLDKLFDFIS